MEKSEKQGYLLAFSAYIFWGLSPLYFKLVVDIPEFEILFHRVVWSVLLLCGLLVVTNKIRHLSSVFFDLKKMSILTITACLLAFNWWLFTWAVNNDKLLDASLGYYINPLLNVALAVLFLSERLNKYQFFAVILAVAGVAIPVFSYGTFPYIAVSLAASFSIYGLVRKKVAVDALSGLFVESMILLIPALIYWLFWTDSPSANMFNNTFELNFTLIMAGVVTTFPLACFIMATKRLHYSVIGFIQYIGPSLMTLLAIFMYSEPFGADRWLTFGFIWSALALFTYGLVRKSHAHNKKTLQP